MKNTTLTIAILTSIAGTIYMPIFGMRMEDGPSTIEVAPSRPRSNQVAPTSMASAATQAAQCNEILSDAGIKLIELPIYIASCAFRAASDIVCFPLAVSTLPCREPANRGEFVCYWTRSLCTDGMEHPVQCCGCDLKPRSKRCEQACCPEGPPVPVNMGRADYPREQDPRTMSDYWIRIYPNIIK